ncbi:MAG: hypothetical protein H6825_14135 [Planctomycetes bacterium]|nr:hypothetical protein [Planctomycetota bacterium]
MSFLRTERRPVRAPVPLALAAGLLFLGPSASAHSPHDVINEMGLSSEPDMPVAIFASTQLTDHRLLARSLDGGQTFTLHALPLAERGVAAISLSPTFWTDGTVFVATTDAGLVVTHDRGDTWSTTGVGLPVNLLSLALLPDFASSGEMVCGTPFGLYVSSDGGQSFTLAGSGLTESKVGVLGATMDAGQRVVLGGGKTLARSTDAGSSWTPLHTFGQRMCALSLSPRFPLDHVALVSLENDGGVFVTTDGGTTWTPMTDGLTELTVPDVDVADDGSLYLVTPIEGLHRASGPLSRWTKVVAPGFEQLSDLTDEHYRTLEVGPKYSVSGRLYVGGFEGLFITDDAAMSFRQGDVYSQRFNRRVVFSPDYDGGGTLYAVNYGGGLYRTPVLASDGTEASPDSSGLPTGGGSGATVPDPHPGLGKKVAPKVETWTSLSRGVTSLFGQCLVLSPRYLTDGTLFYGQSRLFRSSDRGASWTLLPQPPTVPVIRSVAVSPDFANDHLVLFGAGLTGGVYRSTDAGDSWTETSTGLPPSTVPISLRFSPGYPGEPLLFAGTKGAGVVLSSDGGVTWHATGPGLDDPDVRWMELSPDFVNDRTLFAGTGLGGIFRSTDAGDTWAAVNAGLSPGLPLAIECLAISPQFAIDDTLFLVNLHDGVWRSSDRGDSWTKLGAGLPPDPPRVVALSPAFPADPTVVVGTHDWLYRSTDAGVSFERLPGYNRFDDLDYRMVEQGDWTDVPATDGQGEKVTEASLAGSKLTFHCSGDTLRWYGRRGPDMGIARVVVDDEPFTQLDLYAPVESKVAPIYSRTFDEVGFHVINVIVTGSANPLSTGTRVVTDGFDVTF